MATDVCSTLHKGFLHLCIVFIQESRTDMDKGFKLMRERLNSPNFVHEYLLHLGIVYRVLRCVFCQILYSPSGTWYTACSPLFWQCPHGTFYKVMYKFAHLPCMQEYTHKALMSVSLLWKPSQGSHGKFVGYLRNVLRRKTSTYVPAKHLQKQIRPLNNQWLRHRYEDVMAYNMLSPKGVKRLKVSAFYMP